MICTSLTALHPILWLELGKKKRGIGDMFIFIDIVDSFAGMADTSQSVMENINQRASDWIVMK